jgi:hypothetical protein
MTQAEIELRDALLTKCDWTQLPDSPLTDAKKATWRTYRQKLRDLPENTPANGETVWPTPPSP